MHNNGVVHRDLKPENIIIDESGIIKICDFGWASLIELEEKMNIICGTLDYVSPEMVSNVEYTK
jgi:aurora kinase